jgi:hypothetical protein
MNKIKISRMLHLAGKAAYLTSSSFTPALPYSTSNGVEYYF